MLRAASVGHQAGNQLDALKAWALQVQGRTNHNKAACALANELARICYASLRDHSAYGQTQPLNKKIHRQAFVVAS